MTAGLARRRRGYARCDVSASQHPSPRLAFSVEPVALPGGAGVAVRGEVDIHTAPHLSAALDDAARDSRGAFLVDLRDVAFLDSTGIAALVRMRAVLGREDREMAVVCPPGHVRRMLDLAGMAELLELFESREQVVAALRRSVS
jgi:anti-sigma B factor antagonist